MLLVEIINQGCINIKRIITTRSLMFILLVEVEIKVLVRAVCSMCMVGTRLQTVFCAHIVKLISMQSNNLLYKRLSGASYEWEYNHTVITIIGITKQNEVCVSSNTIPYRLEWTYTNITKVKLTRHSNLNLF